MVAALFSYRIGTSLLHKVNAGAKIIFLFAFSVFVFWGTPQSAEELFCLPLLVRTAACFVTSVILFFMAGANWKSLFALRYVFVFGLLVTLAKIVGASAESLPFAAASGLLYTARFFISALAAQCVFETTTMVQIQEALRLPLVVSLAINFIPQIFGEWEKIKLAARARVPKAVRKNPIRACSIFLGQLEVLLLCMLQKAETTRKAVANRRGDF